MTSHYAWDQDGYTTPEFTQGDRLRKARELAGLSQEQLATDLGISKNTVSNYEMGHVAPRQPTLLAWSMRTRVAIWWLKGETPAPPPEAKPATRKTKQVAGQRPRRDSDPRPMAYNGTGSRGLLTVVKVAA